MSDQASTPLLVDFYRQHTIDRDAAALVAKVLERYTVATLERLASSPARETRRAAVLALGLTGGYDSNAVLGRALADADRTVRGLAEEGIQSFWRRQGSEADRRRLDMTIRLNAEGRHKQAVRQATTLIEQAPDLAEAWNQRAIAFYSLGKHSEAIRDCRRVLKLNPYHFGAAGGMGQCYVQQDKLPAVLEAFRHALAINPNLEGIRANVSYLERKCNR